MPVAVLRFCLVQNRARARAILNELPVPTVQYRQDFANGWTDASW